MASMLSGFGSRTQVPGMAVVLDDGDAIHPDSLELLPTRSFIRVGADDVFQYDGDGRWTHMDPSDRDDGDYPASTAELSIYGTDIVVLYRPGDEDL
jgi:hypothetical protein